MPGRPPALGTGLGVLLERGRRPSQDTFRTLPPDQLDRQVAQHPGQAHVVARVHHDQDVPVTSLPLAGRDQALDHGPQPTCGDGRGIVHRSEPDRVQDLRPRRTVRGEHGNERVRPTRHHMVRRAAVTAVDQAEQHDLRSTPCLCCSRAPQQTFANRAVHHRAGQRAEDLKRVASTLGLLAYSEPASHFDLLWKSM